MDNRYGKMSQFLDYISRTYNVSICVKDFSGFIPIDKELDKALQPYLAHTNPYCMYIKSAKRQHFRCLDMMRPMAIKCAKGKPFWGLCYTGVGEYVVPIKAGELILGAVTAGFFNYRPALSRYLLKRISGASAKINYEKARDLFDQYITAPDIETGQMIIYLEIVAEYLANTYLHLQNIHSGEKMPAKRCDSRENTIVAHALEYMKRNFSSRILVKDLAAYCYCSESYINHSFKKRIGMNVSTYINKVRIENAKRRLLHTKDTMTSIALDLGFNDPNYFSRIFTCLVGNTPSEYRRRYS
ncbi:MAG: AraC family transcriptional regulator [Treponema sp.]|jgi:AraC-like DNA-binding protein/ligand-binding sensor protein|nr:AraC family transcriptional regulator [Treponema sp.]